jgi:hypothetical protein
MPTPDFSRLSRCSSRAPLKVHYRPTQTFLVPPLVPITVPSFARHSIAALAFTRGRNRPYHTLCSHCRHTPILARPSCSIAASLLVIKSRAVLSPPLQPIHLFSARRHAPPILCCHSIPSPSNQRPRTVVLPLGPTHFYPTHLASFPLRPLLSPRVLAPPLQSYAAVPSPSASPRSFAPPTRPLVSYALQSRPSQSNPLPCCPRSPHSCLPHQRPPMPPVLCFADHSSPIHCDAAVLPLPHRLLTHPLHRCRSAPARSFRRLPNPLLPFVRCPDIPFPTQPCLSPPLSPSPDTVLPVPV